MIESILDNVDEVNGALLRTGNRELTISPIEKGMLCDLRRFLKPFAEFTKLVSSSVPSLGLVVLIRAKIKRVCASVNRESGLMRDLKRAVMNNMDRRLPISTACHVATLLDPSVKTASELTRAEQVGR